MELTQIDNGCQFLRDIAPPPFSPPSADRRNAIVEVHGDMYPPEINAGDMMCIDFQQTKLSCDSLYVIAADDGWIGVRRFQNMAGAWVVYDESRVTKPQKLASKNLEKIRIIGRVKKVFKAS